ncbi:ABC transporter ATP-binding protein [Gloeobacter kilaueensis]|uniref:Cysteine/glutathione ABC transporter membrane/ATP-binding component n=1 Tax=Gloeobacter kilaueensis (strain ATCC BAA-2537 / CCAP 1431/1 / ULC 316 / JS1) TaxID=1183438 RepID=U5QIB8_GLOK1|nr:ABC transporter ATP-binding protein [Gloeobacter kilaueensis]AGY58638.1 cysteine/glutathione ABC transporter membrane/ATP-binding component [Gloeobacter kilaueensis JS1]
MIAQLRKSLWSRTPGKLGRLVSLCCTVPRRTLYFGLFTMLLASLLDGVGIGLMVPFLKVLLNEGGPAALHLPGGALVAGVNSWIEHQQKGTLIFAFTLVLMAALTLKGYLYYLSQVLTCFYREEVVALLREQLYCNYLRAPVAFFDNIQMGRVTSTLLSETTNVSIMLSFFFAAVTSSLTLLAYLGTLLVVSWRLTVLVVMLIGAVGLGLTFLLNKIRQSGSAVVEARSDLYVRALDALGGIRIIKSYGSEDFEMGKFQAISRRLVETSNVLARKQNVIDPLTEWATLGVAMIILVSSYNLLIARGLLATSELLLFMLVLVRIIPVTKKINTARGYIQENLSAFAQVAAGLELPEEQRDQPGQIVFTGLRESIVFRDVDFSYTGRSKVLTGFDLEVPRGQTVALVGASGAGKSTVAALVPRLYDVASGSIEIDGLDLRAYDITSLRRHIGIVNQDTYIFNTAIRANIAYGLEAVSEARIVEAARLANAHEFICQLPNGYDTLVGDRGVQLSGGQRQRISIARAILRDPEILILDEATSALDSQSEQLVQEALERLRRNRTVIVIAHRLSTVRNADRIVVLDKGRIVEVGEHQQLLKNRGAYWAYLNLQSLPIA